MEAKKRFAGVALLLALVLVACSDGGSGSGTAFIQPGATASQVCAITLADNPLKSDTLEGLKNGTIDASDWFSWTSVARKATGDDGFSDMTVTVDKSSTVKRLVVTLGITAGTEERTVTVSVTIPADCTEKGTEVTKTVATIPVAVAKTPSTTPTAGNNGMGASSLPDLSSARAFSGKSFVDIGEDGRIGDVWLFGADGTMDIFYTQGSSSSGSSGTSSCREWSETQKDTYTYAAATKTLTARVKSLRVNETTWVSNATEYVSAMQTILKARYAKVDIASEYIAAERQWFSAVLQRTVQVACSISDDALLLTNSTVNDGRYKYSQGAITIKFDSTSIGDGSLQIWNGSAELHNPFVTSISGGRFSGSDFKRTLSDDGTTFTITKLGDFSGTYSEQSDGCHITLTSATGAIDSGIQELVGTEYVLPQRTDSGVDTLYPVLKTVRYTVIGSDGVTAITNLQAFIADASETAWSLDTLKILSADYIEGIYADSACTQSVIGKPITEGASVYVTLRELTADAYNEEVFRQ